MLICYFAHLTILSSLFPLSFSFLLPASLDIALFSFSLSFSLALISFSLSFSILSFSLALISFSFSLFLYSLFLSCSYFFLSLSILSLFLSFFRPSFPLSPSFTFLLCFLYLNKTSNSDFIQNKIYFSDNLWHEVEIMEQGDDKYSIWNYKDKGTLPRYFQNIFRNNFLQLYQTPNVKNTLWFKGKYGLGKK